MAKFVWVAARRWWRLLLLVLLGGTVISEMMECCGYSDRTCFFGKPQLTPLHPKTSCVHCKVVNIYLELHTKYSSLYWICCFCGAGLALQQQQETPSTRASSLRPYPVPSLNSQPCIFLLGPAFTYLFYKASLKILPPFQWPEYSRRHQTPRKFNRLPSTPWFPSRATNLNHTKIFFPYRHELWLEIGEE